jgi:hypothetical protein
MLFSLKKKTALLLMPDPADYIYVLIEWPRHRSMLTVHESIFPKNYNKIPANIINFYASVSNFMYIIWGKKN